MPPPPLNSCFIKKYAMNQTGATQDESGRPRLWHVHCIWLVYITEYTNLTCNWYEEVENLISRCEMGLEQTLHFDLTYSHFDMLDNWFELAAKVIQYVIILSY